METQERTTYIVGQWGTFNEAVKIVESVFGFVSPLFFFPSTRANDLKKKIGKPLPKTYRTREDIERALTLPPNQENQEAIFLAGVDEWNVIGAASCPREKTLRQREKYFKGLNFVTIEELLRRSQSGRMI